jgi:RimJ/RimL family protein N-acetyltransferase
MIYRVISEPKDLIAQFVAQVSGFPFTKTEEYSALGLVRDDVLVAGVVYNGYSWPNIMAHIGAVDGAKWATREYLFRQLKCKRITGVMAKRNKRVRRFAEHLGFTFEGKLTKAYPDDDAMIYGLMEENCKWHKQGAHYGQEFIATAGA